MSSLGFLAGIVGDGLAGFATGGGLADTVGLLAKGGDGLPAGAGFGGFESPDVWDKAICLSRCFCQAGLVSESPSTDFGSIEVGFGGIRGLTDGAGGFLAVGGEDTGFLPTGGLLTSSIVSSVTLRVLAFRINSGTSFSSLLLTGP